MPVGVWRTMASKPNISDVIGQVLSSLPKVSDEILKRKDLHDSKQAQELLDGITSLTKDLHLAQVKSPQPDELKTSIAQAINEIETDIRSLIADNAKMSALSGPMNMRKKVPTEVSDAMVNTLKASQSDLFSLNASLATGSAPPDGSGSGFYAAILDEMTAFTANATTTVTVKQIQR